MGVDKAIVCVTGAGGFVASSLVKRLLSCNYTVHGTVRDPHDDKYVHLKKLEKASENLKLFKADLLDYSSLVAAITGCSGVFHVASPVPSGSVTNPEEEVVKPAVEGTLSVLKACSEAKVKRVVYVSSVAAVSMSPKLAEGQVLNETCWSNKEYCRTTGNWYCFSKTEAESQAWQFAKGSGLDLVSVCPTIVLGPVLPCTMNASSLVLVKLLKEGFEQYENKVRWVVDVRDVAEALLLVFEKPEAEGRYICTAHMIKSKDLVEMLRRMYPNYKYPKKFVESEQEKEIILSSEKLKRLGWTCRPLEETLIDSIESYKQAGILN